MSNHKQRVAILDYGMGNLFSVEQACHAVGLTTVLAGEPSHLENTSGLIIPGVGAFGDAMKMLHCRGLVDAIRVFAASGKPVFGICLGMQILFEESEEFGTQKGIGLIEGTVRRIPEKVGELRLKVPQVGWHRIIPKSAANGNDWKNTPLETVKQDSFMHFVHSFYVKPKKETVVIANTSYGAFTFCSAIASENLFACQFHPERSGSMGIRVYEKFKLQMLSQKPIE